MYSIYKLIKKWFGIADAVTGVWLDFFVCLFFMILLVYILIKMRSVQNHRLRVLMFYLLFISVCAVILEGIFILNLSGYDLLILSGIQLSTLLIDIILLLVTVSVLIYSIWYLNGCRNCEVPRQYKRFAVYGIIVGAFTSAAGVVALVRCLGVM